MKEILVSEEESGQRLDKYLKKYFKNASFSFLYKMLRKKNILLNDKKASGSEIIISKDKIKCYFSDDTFYKFKGDEESDKEFYKIEKIRDPDVKILYEDSDIIIVNKPPGVLSQKDREDSISINEEIISYLIKKGELNKESYKTFHPSVSNRLDRNTSGVLLFSKTLKGARFLSDEIKERKAKKYYTALVHGKLEGKFLQELYLKKDEKENKVDIKDHEAPGYSYIKTGFKALKNIYDEKTGLFITYLSVQLYTGKPHQIRATLDFIGHPVLGDKKYGNKALDRSLLIKNELYLHSKKIILENGIIAEAEEPPYFKRFI